MVAIFTVEQGWSNQLKIYSFSMKRCDTETCVNIKGRSQDQKLLYSIFLLKILILVEYVILSLLSF